MRKKNSNFILVLEDYFTTYLPYSRGLSANTINSYKQCFLLLFKFMREKKSKEPDEVSFADLGYDTLQEFLRWLETERNCTAATRNQRLSAISSFSEYAQNRDFDAASLFRTAVNKVPSKKSIKKSRAVFTRDEVRILLSIPDERHETGLRDKVLLSMMYATGARAQEICDLRVRDLQFEETSCVATLTGKGSKTRRVGIGKDCAEIIKGYIQHRGIASQMAKHVFSSQTHEQMTVSCIEGIFKKYVTIAKKDNPGLFNADSYPPHSMRHSTASHLLEAGVDIVTIKNILGHASLQTTQIYAEMSQETVDRKLKEWNEKWFGNKPEPTFPTGNRSTMPDFLTRR